MTNLNLHDELLANRSGCRCFHEGRWRAMQEITVG
jgi:hypothetical protein